MDNINGALAFKATLDINDFNVSAQAMERNIRNVSATAISESDKMDDSIQSFAQMEQDILYHILLVKEWEHCCKALYKHVVSSSSLKLHFPQCLEATHRQRN